MICSDGHIKLIDFGLAKYLGMKDRTFTACGTPEYLAPEVLNNTGHNYSVDIWAFGIALCEMMGGFTPFSDPDQNHMY